MKGLRRNFERFCYKNQNKGIPNLMMWVIIANVLVYVFDMMDPSHMLFRVLAFDRTLILHGQIWRLFTFAFLEISGSNLLIAMIVCLFYYQLGSAIEGAWGTCRFNLYYLSGLLFSDLAGLIFGFYVSPSALHMSLFLAYATMYPDSQFLLFFIIPVKARWLGIFDLALYALEFANFGRFPANLLPLFVLANYLLFFGKDCLNILPRSWQMRRPHPSRKTGKTVPFPGGSAKEQKNYTHKCTVCGRTDVTNPELEFRYCSKCKGYHCYCSDHINNHVHIQ